MSGINWEIGKRYKTRGGEELLLAHIIPDADVDIEESLVFLTNPDCDPQVELYYQNGRYFMEAESSQNDIVSEWTPPETITAHRRTYKLVEE